MIFKMCAIALIASLLALVLGELGFKSRKLFAILSSLLIVSAIADGVTSLLDGFIELSEAAEIADASRSALKIVGLGYVFGITSDVCAELGEGGISNAVTLVGRVEILLVALPYFQKALRLGAELLL